MRIAICDDEPSELQKIRNTAEQFAVPNLPKADITVDAFTSGDALPYDMKKKAGSTC